MIERATAQTWKVIVRERDHAGSSSATAFLEEGFSTSKADMAPRSVVPGGSRSQ